MQWVLIQLFINGLGSSKRSLAFISSSHSLSISLFTLSLSRSIITLQVMFWLSHSPKSYEHILKHNCSTSVLAIQLFLCLSLFHSLSRFLSLSLSPRPSPSLWQQQLIYFRCFYFSEPALGRDAFTIRLCTPSTSELSWPGNSERGSRYGRQDRGWTISMTCSKTAEMCDSPQQKVQDQCLKMYDKKS